MAEDLRQRSAVLRDLMNANVVTTTPDASVTEAAAGMRLLTSPPLRRLVAGTWSLYWNGLADGAAPRPSARSAALVEDLAWRLASRGPGS